MLMSVRINYHCLKLNNQSEIIKNTLIILGASSRVNEKETPLLANSILDIPFYGVPAYF